MQRSKGNPDFDHVRSWKNFHSTGISLRAQLAQDQLKQDDNTYFNDVRPDMVDMEIKSWNDHNSYDNVCRVENAIIPSTHKLQRGGA
jgi:hypothetical protein